MDTTPHRTTPASKAPPPGIPATEAEKTASAAFSEIKAKSIQLDQVMAKYDVCKISPREIDALIEGMLMIGQPLNADILMLSSFGEDFLDHLAEMTGQPYDASVKVDMISVANDQRGVAIRAGDTTENWDDFIAFLEKFQSRVEAYLNGPKSAYGPQQPK